MNRGIEQGIGQRKESVIKAMLQKNTCIEDIHDIAGKSIEEIKKNRRIYERRLSSLLFFLKNIW